MDDPAQGSHRQVRAEAGQLRHGPDDAGERERGRVHDTVVRGEEGRVETFALADVNSWSMYTRILFCDIGLSYIWCAGVS